MLSELPLTFNAYPRLGVQGHQQRHLLVLEPGVETLFKFFQVVNLEHLARLQQPAAGLQQVIYRPPADGILFRIEEQVCLYQVLAAGRNELFYNVRHPLVPPDGFSGGPQKPGDFFEPGHKIVRMPELL
jgi:hypothetical protein